MSRYLTPSKISLLALVTLYCEGAVSSSGTIPVLSFIVSYLLPPSSGATQQSFNLTIDELEKVIIVQPSTHPGRTVYDLFLRKLWNINSFHALHEFFEGLGGLLARTKEQIEQDHEAGITHPPDAIFLSRTSPLGAFIRRAQLEFTRLQFHDALKLWVAFLKYKEPTGATWKRRNPQASSASFDINIDSLGLDAESPLLNVAYSTLDEPISSDEAISVDDMERLLTFQSDRLQRLGLRMPQSMKQNLREMIGPGMAVPTSTHYVRFLDAWRAGDYTSAFDNLHRYFDYTMQTRDKTSYQNALLNMAMLQTDFGCLSEAIEAISETIATARENQDMACLNFSLSWLSFMSQAYPHHMKGMKDQGLNGSERDALNFLKLKAKEGRMYSLLSSALLSEARLDLSYGERSVSKAFQHVYQASHINIRENLTSNVGSQLLVHAAIFDRIGLHHLGSAYRDVLMQSCGPNGSTDDDLRAACLTALKMAQSGRYDQAIAQLENKRIKVQRTLKYNQLVTGYLGVIKLFRVIRRADVAAAETILRQLTTGVATHPEFRVLISELTIDFHTQLGSLSKAFDLIETQASALKEEAADISQRLRLLIQKARVFAKAGKPVKGFSVALRAASTAHRFQVYPCFYEALGCLANILIHLSEFDAARRLLDAIIPQVLEGGDVELCATLYSLQADAYMGMAGKDEDPAGRQRISCVSKAELYIERAGQNFKRIQAVRGECEMLMKRAVIARLRGDEKLANDWAAQYLSVHAAAKEQGAGGQTAR